MNTLPWLLSALAAGVVIVWIAIRVVRSLRQYWGKSVVTCPETHQAVAVKIGPKAAAAAGLLELPHDGAVPAAVSGVDSGAASAAKRKSRLGRCCVGRQSGLRLTC